MLSSVEIYLLCLKYLFFYNMRKSTLFENMSMMTSGGVGSFIRSDTEAIYCLSEILSSQIDKWYDKMNK
jgi:hypothetical protein